MVAGLPHNLSTICYQHKLFTTCLRLVHWLASMMYGIIYTWEEQDRHNLLSMNTTSFLFYYNTLLSANNSHTSMCNHMCMTILAYTNIYIYMIYTYFYIILTYCIMYDILYVMAYRPTIRFLNRESYWISTLKGWYLTWGRY